MNPKEDFKFIEQFINCKDKVVTGECQGCNEEVNAILEWKQEALNSQRDEILNWADEHKGKKGSLMEGYLLSYDLKQFLNSIDKSVTNERQINDKSFEAEK